MMVKHDKGKAATKGLAVAPKASGDARESPAAIAKRIKWLRGHLGYNQTEFGKQIGAVQQAVSGWESGQEKYSLGLAHALVICRTFDVSLDFLYRGRTSGLTVAMEQAFREEN